MHPTLHVDDASYFGGINALMGWPPQTLYLIEVYASGLSIRVYTRNYVQLLAMGRTTLPVIIH